MTPHAQASVLVLVCWVVLLLGGVFGIYYRGPFRAFGVVATVNPDEDASKKPMDLPQELLDYEEKADRLARFDSGLDAILLEALGQDWLLAKPEEKERLLTPRQRDWRDLRYFYEASIVNSGDLFGYLSMVYSRPELFEQIGAVKTLAAAEDLKVLHDAYSQLPTDDERNKYRRETREQRKPIEQTAEDLLEFADLLIRFAERHPEEFPEMEPQNPFDRVSELAGSLRRKKVETGRDTKGLDAAARLFEHVRNSLSDGDDKEQ